MARFQRWLAQHLNPDGSFKDNALSCNAYMPMPYYAHVTGQPELTFRFLQQVELRFLRDGHLIQPSNRQSMLTYSPSWILIGLGGSEHLRLRQWLIQYVLGFQNETTGGFFGSNAARGQGEGEIDFDSTTTACAALCLMGRATEAERTGQFLLRLANTQPNIEKEFFLVWHTKHGLQRDFDPAHSTGYVTQWNQPRQHLYKMGLLIRAFTLLHGLTANDAYLRAAEELYSRVLSRSVDVWTNTLSHKMSWAASTLFLATAKARYAEDACRLADHLFTLQQADGWFHYPEFWPSPEKVTLEQKLNIGAQFASWITLTRQALMMAQHANS